jgi:hypothetical protein
MPVASADLAGGGELKCFWLAELLEQPAGQRVRGRKEGLAVGCQVVDVEDALRGRGVVETLAPKVLAENRNCGRAEPDGRCRWATPSRELSPCPLLRLGRGRGGRASAGRRPLR